MAVVKVTGTVEDVKENRYIITEYYLSNNGDEWRRRWTVWTSTGLDALSKGDIVELEGTLSTKITTWTKDGVEKTLVDHNLNNPSIIKHDPVIPVSTVPRMDEDDARKYGAPF